MSDELEKKEPGLEERFAKIDAILDAMEDENVTLDRSFALYKEGLEQIKAAGQSLDTIEKAMLAGLLHDCAKCLSTEKKIGLCVKKNIDITEVEISNPGLLHAKAGMVLAEEEYGIKNAQILHAIRVHTTGEADMGLLDKILFVADYIEPNRCEAPRLEEIRKLAFSELDRTVAEILYDTINFLNTKSGAIDPTTQITYNYYAKYRDNREE